MFNALIPFIIMTTMPYLLILFNNSIILWLSCLIYTSHIRRTCKCQQSTTSAGGLSEQGMSFLEDNHSRPSYRIGSSCGSGVAHTLEPESGAPHIAANCAVTGIQCRNRLSRSNLGMWPPYWKGSGAGSPQTMTCLVQKAYRSLPVWNTTIPLSSSFLERF